MHLWAPVGAVAGVVAAIFGVLNYRRNLVVDRARKEAAANRWSMEIFDIEEDEREAGLVYQGAPICVTSVRALSPRGLKLTEACKPSKPRRQVAMSLDFDDVGYIRVLFHLPTQSLWGRFLASLNDTTRLRVLVKYEDRGPDRRMSTIKLKSPPVSWVFEEDEEASD